MSAAEVLAELRRHGVELWLEGGDLRYRGPAGALTEELRAAAAAVRDELSGFLRDEAARCADCGQVRLIMLAMAPGSDGKPWRLCSRCWA